MTAPSKARTVCSAISTYYTYIHRKGADDGGDTQNPHRDRKLVKRKEQRNYRT